MPRQDVDPLADTLPPRYAYESDDEDESGLTNVPAPDAPAVEVTFLPHGTEREVKGGVLIVVSAAVGAVWSRGAKLGEQIGQVNVNKHMIGMVFRPAWANQESKGTVLVSEALSRLPVWAMNAYAGAVLERWNPSKVILLDAYSTATYISPTPIPHHEAPLRYLSTERTPPSPKIPLSLFAPPNLLQTTSAAFLSLLSLSSSTGFAILVPSRRAPPPTPRSLSRDEDDSEETASTELAAISGLEDTEDWDSALLRDTHRVVLELADALGSGEDWVEPGASRKGKRGMETTGRRRRVTEAEGGMYI